jgi:beta-glucosidase/6-phospho-beta-glucosidase/beta-galactosidase
VPWGFRKLLRVIKRRWSTATPVPIYITEKGLTGDHEGDRSLSEIVDDRDRQDYFRGYLEVMRLAIVEDQIDVAGYFG